MRLGEKQVLTVVKKVDFGVYLGTDEEYFFRRSRSRKGSSRGIRWKYFFTKIPPTG